MTSPSLTLKDHLNATSGAVSIEVGHAAHFECVSASTIGEGDWYQAKIEWQVDDTGADYVSGMRGFNFSHYFEAEGTFTVTCRVTNVAGEDSTAQRTVIVGASTRTIVNVNSGDNLKTVFDANSGANKEFVLAGDVTVSSSISPGSNNVFRSSVPGVKVNVAWTGSTTSHFNLSSVDSVSWKDLNFTRTGGTRSASVIQFGGTNLSVIDCSVPIGVCSGQMLNCASNPRGVLIQDTETIHDSAGQCIWVGNAIDSRMLAVYGGSHIANVDNSERALRGSGIYVAINDSYLEMANISGGKDVMSINGGSFRYTFRSQLWNSTPSGTGTLLLTGHTSGTTQVSDIVFDRCVMGFTNRVGSWRIGATGFGSCTRMMVRNCVLRGVVITPENVSVASFHHNTHYNPSGGARWMNVNSSALTASGLTFTGNLSVWGATATEAILITSTTDTNSEFTLVSNNITGTPSQEDCDINDAVNGNKDEQYATFNARSNASGNLRKTVTIDTDTFRPVDTADTDLLVTPHSDLTPFTEDHYGNVRSGLWVIGAVDDIPDPQQWILLQAAGFTYIMGS